MSAEHAPPASHAEVTLDFHRTYFRTEWTTRSGNAFQEFFEDIMIRADETFAPIAPAGSQGDKKSDGFRTSDGTNYQVYAPPSGLKTKETCDKITADFEGAKARWPTMKRWVFVWSSPRGGLPPEAVQLLDALDTAHENITVRQWGETRLWQKARDLPEADRNELFRPFPAIARTDDTQVAADVISLLNSVSSMPRVGSPDNFALTAPKEKLQRNRLGPATESLVLTAMGLVPTVKHLAVDHPDPGFAGRVASALRSLYETGASSISDPDQLFLRLVKDVGGEQTDDENRFWAAAAIVTRSFEICDVFEP